MRAFRHQPSYSNRLWSVRNWLSCELGFLCTLMLLKGIGALQIKCATKVIHALVELRLTQHTASFETQMRIPAEMMRRQTMHSDTLTREDAEEEE